MLKITATNHETRETVTYRIRYGNPLDECATVRTSTARPGERVVMTAAEGEREAYGLTWPWTRG